MKNFYCGIIKFGNFLQSFLLLALRVFWGFSFFQAGWGKINNIDPVIGFFKNLGIAMPGFMAPFVGWVECIGGLCLLFGFASRLISIPLAITMIVAMVTAHYDAVLGLVENYQTNLSNFLGQDPIGYLVASLAVLSFGPGWISIDAIIGGICCRKKEG